MKNDQINYISFDEIDADKWDGCIAKSPNALVYAQSWYLDKIIDRWDALVYGDYQYVMPLTFRKKLNVVYLFQPIFSQQLGIFPTPTKEILTQFLNKSKQLFPFAEINLNTMNLPLQNFEGEFFPRKNFLLPLHSNYETLSKNYSNHTKRKLKKAKQNKLNIIGGISIEEYLNFKRQNQKTKISDRDYLRLRNILAFAVTKSMGQIYGVYSAKNSLCAAVFLLRFKNRVTYLNAASSDEGRDLNAMYFLIDQFISENADSEFMIDFEGSMIPGVARLYEGFGANPEIYHQLKWNDLSIWSRWLKK